MGLVPDGGRLDQEVRTAREHLLRHTGCWSAVVWGHPAASGRRLGDGLAVEGSQWDGSDGTAERLPGEDAAACLGGGRRGSARGGDLDPVARLVTTRTAYRVLDADGELVLEIADDQVESGPADGESTLHSWREVEVELGPAGKKKDLKRAGKLLRAAGATPSAIGTKLDRALGPCCRAGRRPRSDRARSGSWWPDTWRRSAMCSPATTSDCGLVRRWCTTTRVAARRLRSTLRVFGDVVDAAPAEELNNELAWYADLLGQVRDREVLNARLTELIADAAAGACSRTGRGRDHQDSGHGTRRRHHSG